MAIEAGSHRGRSSAARAFRGHARFSVASSLEGVERSRFESFDVHQRNVHYKIQPYRAFEASYFDCAASYGRSRRTKAAGSVAQCRPRELDRSLSPEYLCKSYQRRRQNDEAS
jgi:hypothetical protein